MVVKVKESFEKTRQIENTFYEDKEVKDKMIEFYPVKIFFIISRLSSVQKNI